MRNPHSHNHSGSTLVYSTEAGRICPTCRLAVAHCTCKSAAAAAAAALPPTDGIVRVSLDTKGRKGKGVTVVKGVPLDAIALTQLGKQLKANCGSGGTVKDGVIEVQGDHRDTIITALQKQGYTVKRAGG
jgi:translation initiation factor 1